MNQMSLPMSSGVIRDRLCANQGVIDRLHNLTSQLEDKLAPVLGPECPPTADKCSTVSGPAMSEYEAILVSQNEQMDTLGIRLHRMLERLAV